MNKRQLIPTLIFVLAALVVLAGLVMSACGVNAAERTNAGNLLYEQGVYNAALDAHHVAQVLAPDDAAAYFNAAAPLVGVGRLQSAAAALEQALKTADESLAGQAYYNLGNVYFDLAQFQQAVDAYRETLLRRPDDENARYNYELALRRLATSTPTPTPEPTDESEEEQQQPNEESTPTPTPEPPSDVPPEETAEPQENAPSEQGEESGTPTPQPGGVLTVEQAQQLLDAVQQNQQTLNQYWDEPQMQTPERDW